MDQYFLSDEPSKFLMTQHFHSSMNEPNLDNVQAKLNATRQKNHDLAMQYFQSKYGTTQIYEQFTKTHNLGQVNTVMSQANNLQRHLQLKARQIRKRQKQKFGQKNQNIKIEQNDVQEQIFDFRAGRATTQQKNKNRKNNPWVNRQKNSSHNRNSQISSNNNNYVIDTTKNYQQHKEGEFINQFKHYLINKSKLNNTQTQIIENKTQNLQKSSYGLAQSKFVDKSQLMKSKAGNKSPKKTRNYEEELAKKIYKDLINQSRDNSKVEKLTLIQHLAKNKKILKVLDMNEQSLNQKLSEHPTSLQTEITLQQFLFFLLKTVGKQDQINHILEQKRQKNIPEGCVLDKDTIIHFQEIFKNLDRHTDLIIKRLQYTNRIANDPLISKIIDLPAVYQQQLDKMVSLRRILERIQLQAILGSEQQQKVKEYISWNQFIGYFRSGHHVRGNYQLMILIDSFRQEQKFGLFQLPDAVLDILLWGIRRVDKGNQYFNTYALIDQISKHPEFQHQKYGLARQQSKISNLPTETFEQILSRIKVTAPKYVTIKQLFEYFSSRGKPMQEMNKTKNQNLNKNFSGVKVKFAQKDFIQKQQQIDGYDSDPQMYSSQVNQNSFRKTSRSAKKLSGNIQTNPLNQSMQKQEAQIFKKQFKVTVPQPFSFDERERNRQKKQVSVISENNYQFKAKPVPNKVKNRELYEKMLEEDRKRMQQRKKYNMIMTLANEKPFSFLQRKTNKKTKQQRQQFKFKAKPIPWFCSVDLLNKKKQAQIIRNQKIAKQAQQSLAKAKLPPRMQRDFQEKLAQKAHMSQSKQKKEKKNTLYKQPPDFDRIHRQFEQGLQRKRKQNKVTEPQQFNFAKRADSKSKTAGNFKDQIISVISNIKPSDDYKKHLEPKPSANSTLKFNQQVERRRIQMEQKRKKEERKKRQEEERAKIDSDLQKRLLSLAKNKENKEKEERQKRQRQMQQQDNRHKQWKKQRIEKGRQQPMLIQRPLKRDEKIQKMKKLAQISKTLKQNGIKGKDHDSYFKREQLLMLQDWQQLKDRIK